MKTKGKTKVYERVNRSGTVSWMVDLGGRDRKRLSFKTEQEARKVAYDYDVQNESKQYTAAADLGVLMAIRYELLDNYNRLRAVGATFNDAVDFYLKKSKRAKGDISIQDTFKLLIENKRTKGCSDRYIDSITGTYYPPFAKHFGPETMMTQITPEQLTKYINSKTEWGNNTKRGHITNLNVAFSFLVDKGYLVDNPMAEVDRPMKTQSDIHFMKPHQVEKILKAGLKKKMYDCVAVHILVLFCGIRMEEACKMTWADVDRNWVVNVSGRIAKLRQQRRNVMPENARKWWLCCRPATVEERKELIILGDIKHKLADMRKLVKGLVYQKNSARHSFATYHIMYSGSAEQTALMMGHIGDHNTLYNHYRNAVTLDDAKQYFELVPSEEEIKTHQKRKSFVLLPIM